MRMNWLFLLVLPAGLAAQATGVCDPTVLIWAVCVSVDWLDGYFRDAASGCQPGPDRLRWTRQPERDSLRHLQRTASRQPGDGELRGEIGLFGELETAGRFRRFPEF